MDLPFVNVSCVQTSTQRSAGPYLATVCKSPSAKSLGLQALLTLPWNLLQGCIEGMEGCRSQTSLHDTGAMLEAARCISRTASPPGERTCSGIGPEPFVRFAPETPVYRRESAESERTTSARFTAWRLRTRRPQVQRTQFGSETISYIGLQNYSLKEELRSEGLQWTSMEVGVVPS